jgi:hypothetical protein
VYIESRIALGYLPPRSGEAWAVVDRGEVTIS